MRRFYIFATGALLLLMLIGAGWQSVALAQATSTYTPSPTANFVLPLINVPIVLPTAFMPPMPTSMAIHITAAPNMNPYNLEVPGNPVWAWQEGLNWMDGILSVMGWMGNLLYFTFILVMVMAMIRKVRRGIMGEAPTEKPAKWPGRRSKA